MNKKSKKATGSSEPVAIQDLDFVTSVDLKCLTTPSKDGDKIIYHGIYASQLYGTLFGIYAKFIIDKKTREDCCFVKGVHLKLLNYKGIVNIGFPQESIKVDTANKKIVINFDVQAALANDEMTIEFSKPIEVNRPGFRRIVFNRTLLPLPGFDVDPANKDDATVLKKPRPAPIPSTPLFDTEFHYRDGVDYYDSILHDGMAGFDAKLHTEETEVFSYRCVQSNVHLVYY